MNKRTVFCAVVLSALATPALADGFRFVDGEAGWAYVGAPRGNTVQQQVKRKDMERNLVTADGWKQVGGEAGWLYVGPQRRNTPEQIALARGTERNADSTNGWKQVGGEAGWLYVGRISEDARAWRLRAQSGDAAG